MRRIARAGLLAVAVLYGGCGGSSSKPARDQRVTDPPTTRPASDSPGAGAAADPAPLAPVSGAGCADLLFNLDKGTINGVPATASMAEVKQQFPCSTGESEEGSAFNYGGGVFFTKHDFYFYTGRDFVEVRLDFRGRTEPKLLGRDFAAYQAEMGPPMMAGGIGEGYYARWYGCLRIVPDRDGTMIEVAAHFEPCDKVAAWWLP